MLVNLCAWANRRKVASELKLCFFMAHLDDYCSELFICGIHDTSSIIFQRGWTTWTIGAVDERVVAIAPIVMDLLNMVEVAKL